MTGPAKILVVLICLLSVAFFAVSGALFAKRADYRDLYEKDLATWKEETRKLREFNLRVIDEVKNARQQRDAANASAAIAENQARELAAKTADLGSQLSAQTKQNDTLMITINSNMASLARLTADNAELSELREKLGNENLALLTQRQKNLEDIQNLQTTLNKLTDEFNAAKEELAAANKTLDQQRNVLSALWDRFYETRPLIRAGVPVPNINAKVILVGGDGKTAVINAGTKQGVRKNIEFTVFRGDKYLGAMTITEVDGEDLAAGELTRLQDKIQVGDSVATNLGM